MNPRVEFIVHHTLEFFVVAIQNDRALALHPIVAHRLKITAALGGRQRRCLMIVFVKLIHIVHNFERVGAVPLIGVQT